MFDRLRQLFSSPTHSSKPLLVRTHPHSESDSVIDPGDLTHLLAVETVVDRQGKSAGKFIRLRHGSRQHLPEHSQHADTVLLESLSRVLDTLRGKQSRILLVELGASCLPHPIMDQLAASKAVLLLAQSAVPPSALFRLDALKKAGLRVALWMPGEWMQDVMALADGYVFSFDGRSPIEAAELVDKMRQKSPNAALIVVDIGWREEYNWCRRIGCHYAAGKLFRAPNWPDGPIDPGFVRVLDTLNKVRRDADPAEIAQTMKSDPLLTFRLLAQANSASMGLGRKVETIEQSVVVIGRSRLYRWLVLLLYATGKGSDEGPVLQEMAQVRAELMVKLGERYLPGEAEGLYLTGLFSMLEPLMQRPLARILEGVMVPDAVREALLQRSGAYAPFLALAEAAEQSEGVPGDLLAACGIHPVDFNRCLLEALIKTEISDESPNNQRGGDDAAD